MTAQRIAGWASRSAETLSGISPVRAVTKRSVSR